MNIKQIAIDFISIFTIALAVTVIVTFLWNWLAHGSATVDMEASFRFAIIFGIIFPWLQARERNKNRK